MIADRWIFTAKDGKLEKAAAMASAERARILQETDYSEAFRIYVSDTGKIVIETEWNSLAEQETWWAKWRESPEGTAFQEKFFANIELNEGVEIWSLVD